MGCSAGGVDGCESFRVGTEKAGGLDQADDRIFDLTPLGFDAHLR